MSEEINSPPFPVDTSTIPRLLRHLTDLRSWLVDLRFWANETASHYGMPDEIVPPSDKIPAIPELHRFELVALTSMMSTYMNMRKLRESWDQMVRVYEDSWDAKPAVMWRLQCVHWAYLILIDAFVDPETREARQEQMQQEAKKFMKKMLHKMGVPKEFLGEGTSFHLTPFGMGMELQGHHPEEIDFDELFHGKSEEDESEENEDS